MCQEVAQRSLNRRSSSKPIVRTSPILCGSLDPDGHVEVVFYDAHEFGDGMDDDNFAASYRPESVLVPSILSKLPRGGAMTKSDADSSLPPPPPPPPQELPLRFLRAGKGDPVEGLRRYEATLEWRKENRVDTILREAFPHFRLIKQHYQTFCH